MRKFLILLRVSLRSMLYTFSFGRGKKRAASGAAALLFLGGMALYMSGLYSFLMADGLHALGLLEFLLPIMSLLACVAALMFTAFGASGVVFGNKDSDLLLSLPVSSFSIMLSKILALYLENLLFCGLWMIPTCLAYFLKAQPALPGFLLYALLCIPFLPLLPTLLGVLAGYCVAFFSARAKRKALVSNLLYFLLFGGIIVGSLQINKISALLVTNADLLRSLLKTWLLPFGLLHRGIALGDALSVLTFCAVCALPFFVAVYLLSAQYKRILSSLSCHASRSDFQLTPSVARGRFSTLLRKEVSRYFGTPIYFFNTGIGVLMLLGGAVYLCFARQSALAFTQQAQLTETLPQLVCAALIFCLSTVCPTCVSISLEGKSLWILREAPISTNEFFGAKLLLNFLVAWPASVISLLLASWALSLPLLALVCIFIVATLFIVHICMFGLIVNLLLPKMDAANDMLVVKQSASSLCGIFGSMLFAGLGMGAYLLFGAAIGFLAFLCIVSAVLAAVCLCEWRWLTRQGAERFLRDL